MSVADYLILCSFLPYVQCLKGEFMYDDIHIQKNDDIGRGDWLGILKQGLKRGWRGLTNSTFAWTLKFFGFAEIWFHIANCALHALNAGLVYVILGLLDVPEDKALLGAMLFAVHTLATNAVAYISGRSVLLSANFWFAAIALTLAGWPSLALLCLPMAMFAKEDAIVLPIAVGAVALWQGNLFGLVCLAAPLLIVAIGWKHFHYRMVNNGSQGLKDAGFPDQIKQPAYSFIAITETVIRYPFWALGLWQSPDYETQESSWSHLQSAVMILIAAIALFLLIPGSRLPLILLMFTPAAIYAFIPMPDLIAEYRFYISILGLIVAAVSLPVWALAILITYFAWRTAGYALYWRKAEWLWGRVLKSFPNHVRACINLGVYYQLKGELDATEYWNKKALENNPNVAAAWCNLALVEQGRWERLRQKVCPFCKSDPPPDKVCCAENEAAIKAQVDRSFEFYEEAVRRCPRHTLGWRHMATAYATAQRPDQAERCLLKLLELLPRDHEAMNNLGVVRLLLSRPDEALPPLMKAVESDKNPQYRFNLGNAYLFKKNVEEAKRWFADLPPEFASRIPQECR